MEIFYYCQVSLYGAQVNSSLIYIFLHNQQVFYLSLARNCNHTLLSTSPNGSKLLWFKTGKSDHSCGDFPQNCTYINRDAQHVSVPLTGTMGCRSHWQEAKAERLKKCTKNEDHVLKISDRERSTWSHLIWGMISELNSHINNLHAKLYNFCNKFIVEERGYKLTINVGVLYKFLWSSCFIYKTRCNARSFFIENAEQPKSLLFKTWSNRHFLSQLLPLATLPLFTNPHHLRPKQDNISIWEWLWKRLCVCIRNKTKRRYRVH